MPKRSRPEGVKYFAEEKQKGKKSYKKRGYQTRKRADRGPKQCQRRFRHWQGKQPRKPRRESGPLPPPARRPAISVHRPSTHAVAGAGTWLDKFVADIAELAAVWRRGVVSADEARLLCELCASTSGPVAAPANAPVALAAQCVVVAGAARRLLARLEKARDGRVVAPDRLVRGVANLVTLMEELEV
jgi:hypothetical protein